jgi:hypothetical protein
MGNNGRKSMKAERPKVGRPSSYRPETGDLICERLSLGESLRAICSTPGMPSMPAVSRWLDAQPEFRSQYALARQAQADFLAAQVVEIADAATNENVQAARLRCDARRWYASKLFPRKYGERLADPSGDHPADVVVIRRFVSDESEMSRGNPSAA